MPQEISRTAATSPGGFKTGSVSVEYFPPANLSAERALITGAHALRRFSPSFQTLTSGANGGTRHSADLCAHLQAITETPTASHLATSHFDEDGLKSHLDNLWESEIRHLVIIRGDVGEGSLSVTRAIELTKERHPFEISVAAYPEVHPMAENASSDLAALKDKFSAGADRAITQYFFDNKLFWNFLDKAKSAGIRKPIVPGIMPIANFERIKTFSEKCGASIPAHFEADFAKCGEDRAAQSDLARDLVSQQVSELAQEGCASIHIYSLNRVDLTADTIRAFQGTLDQIEETLPALAG